MKLRPANRGFIVDVKTAIAFAAFLIPAASAASIAQTQTVFHVQLFGPLEVAHVQIVERALTAADREPGALVVFEINSAGGRMDLAQLMVSDLLASPHRTYAFINVQAWSATALFAMASDSIFMNDRASLGGGDSIATSLRELPETAVQAMQASFGTLAKMRGGEERTGQAMITIEGDRLLTLTATEAVEAGIAAGVVKDIDGLMHALGVTDPEIVPVGSTWTGTTVEVQNFNVQDARVFIVRGASRFRLGTVTSMGSSNFDVPGRFLPDGATIRVGIELIGSSERLETERIRVQPGLVIRWVIENALRQSSFSYYVR